MEVQFVIYYGVIQEMLMDGDLPPEELDFCLVKIFLKCSCTKIT